MALECIARILAKNNKIIHVFLALLAPLGARNYRTKRFLRPWNVVRHSLCCYSPVRGNELLNEEVSSHLGTRESDCEALAFFVLPVGRTEGFSPKGV